MIFSQSLLLLCFLFVIEKEVTPMKARVIQGYKVLQQTTTERSTSRQFNDLFFRKHDKPELQLYTFVGSIQYKNIHICGSSILSPYWILTAAHCCFNKQKSLLSNELLSVGVGHPQIQHQKQRKIAAKVCHPKYDHVWATNDVAVFQVSQPFVFDDNVQPINLYHKRIDDEPIDATVLGWGFTSKGTQLVKKNSDDLHYVPIYTVPQDHCKEHVRNLQQSQICAFNDDGMKGTCQGDSGGPLVAEIAGELMQIGILSFGSGSCNNTKPEVYTRISSFHSWLKNYTRQPIIDIFDY